MVSIEAARIILTGTLCNLPISPNCWLSLKLPLTQCLLLVVSFPYQDKLLQLPYLVQSSRNASLVS